MNSATIEHSVVFFSEKSVDTGWQLCYGELPSSREDGFLKKKEYQIMGMKKRPKIDAADVPSLSLEDYAIKLVEKHGGVRKAARILGVAPSTVSRWVRVGRPTATS